MDENNVSFSPSIQMKWLFEIIYIEHLMWHEVFNFIFILCIHFFFKIYLQLLFTFITFITVVFVKMIYQHIVYWFLAPQLALTRYAPKNPLNIKYPKPGWCFFFQNIQINRKLTKTSRLTQNTKNFNFFQIACGY